MSREWAQGGRSARLDRARIEGRWPGVGRADERVRAEAKEVPDKEGVVVGRHDVGRDVGCVRVEHCCRGINEGVMGGLEGG